MIVVMLRNVAGKSSIVIDFVRPITKQRHISSFILSYQPAIAAVVMQDVLLWIELLLSFGHGSVASVLFFRRRSVWPVSGRAVWVVLLSAAAFATSLFLQFADYLSGGFPCSTWLAIYPLLCFIFIDALIIRALRVWFLYYYSIEKLGDGTNSSSTGSVCTKVMKLSEGERVLHGRHSISSASGASASSSSSSSRCEDMSIFVTPDNTQKSPQVLSSHDIQKSFPKRPGWFSRNRHRVTTRNMVMAVFLLALFQLLVGPFAIYSVTLFGGGSNQEDFPGPHGCTHVTPAVIAFAVVVALTLSLALLMSHRLREVGDGFYILWDLKRITVTAVLACVVGGFVGFAYPRPAHLHVSFAAFQIVIALTLTTPAVQSFLYATQQVKEVYLIDRELSKVKRSRAGSKNSKNHRASKKESSQCFDFPPKTQQALDCIGVRSDSVTDRRGRPKTCLPGRISPGTHISSARAKLSRTRSQPTLHLERLAFAYKGSPQAVQAGFRKTEVSVSRIDAHTLPCSPSPIGGQRSRRPVSRRARTPDPPHCRTRTKRHESAISRSPSLSRVSTYSLPLAPHTCPLRSRTPQLETSRSRSPTLSRSQVHGHTHTLSLSHSVTRNSRTSSVANSPAHAGSLSRENSTPRFATQAAFQFDLKSVLAHPKLSRKFLKFLTLEFAVENLQFLRVVDRLASLTSPADINRRALEIYFTFVANNSDFQVNLSDRIRKTTRDSIARCFETFPRTYTGFTSVLVSRNTSCDGDMKENDASCIVLRLKSNIPSSVYAGAQDEVFKMLERDNFVRFRLGVKKENPELKFASRPSFFDLMRRRELAGEFEGPFTVNVIETDAVDDNTQRLFSLINEAVMGV